ncbi:MAG: hypothetical protein ACREAA_02730 [Candidatus Polarisedimenticolia bacterium]
MDRCDIPRCRDEASIVYLGRGVCETHWNKITADDVPDGALRMVLGLPTAQDAAVDGGRAAMDDGQKTSKGEHAEAAPAKVKARTKKAAPAKATAKAPAEKKSAREPIEDACVFAFRLSVADRTRIHEAAGPAKATRFVRGAALAAATGDLDAFKALVAGRATK